MLTRNTRNTILAGMILSIMLVPAGTAFAYGKGDGPKGEGHHKKWEERAQKMHEELGLTEEQQAALKAHKEGHWAQMKDLREQLKAKKEELRAIMQSADFDEAKVRAIHNEIKALKDKKEDLRLEGIMEVRKILTPEQFQKFEEMKSKFKEKHKERFKDKSGKNMHGHDDDGPHPDEDE